MTRKNYLNALVESDFLSIFERILFSSSTIYEGAMGAESVKATSHQ